MVSETPIMCTMSSVGVSSWSTAWIIVTVIFLLSLFILIAFIIFWLVVKKNEIAQEKNEVQTKEKRQGRKRRVKKK